MYRKKHTRKFRKIGFYRVEKEKIIYLYFFYAMFVFLLCEKCELMIYYRHKQNDKPKGRYQMIKDFNHSIEHLKGWRIRAIEVGIHEDDIYSFVGMMEIWFERKKDAVAYANSIMTINENLKRVDVINKGVTRYEVTRDQIPTKIKIR